MCYDPKYNPHIKRIRNLISLKTQHKNTKISRKKDFLIERIHLNYERQILDNLKSRRIINVKILKEIKP